MDPLDVFCVREGALHGRRRRAIRVCSVSDFHKRLHSDLPSARAVVADQWFANAGCRAYSGSGVVNVSPLSLLGRSDLVAHSSRDKEIEVP